MVFSHLLFYPECPHLGICFRKAINLIELGKVHKQELDASVLKISKLEGLILTKDGIIAEHKKKDVYNDSAILAYKGIVSNLNKSLSNAELSFLRLSTLEINKLIESL